MAGPGRIAGHKHASPGQGAQCASGSLAGSPGLHKTKIGACDGAHEGAHTERANGAIKNQCLERTGPMTERSFKKIR